MENLEEVIYRLKSERHDFNNHLGVIYGLLGNGEKDEATVYASQLVQTAEEYCNIVDLPYSMFRTTKPDLDNHGFGLPNISYLVSRHNGLMKIEQEDGVFSVNIALLAKYKQKRILSVPIVSFPVPMMQSAFFLTINVAKISF